MEIEVTENLMTKEETLNALKVLLSKLGESDASMANKLLDKLISWHACELLGLREDMQAEMAEAARED